MSAPVSRDCEFINALGSLSDDPKVALDHLKSLLPRFAEDMPSRTEVERWISRCLKSLGNYQEAYDLLRSLETRVVQLAYDSSLYAYEILNLLFHLDRVAEADAFCSRFSPKLTRASEALGHLDWMALYVKRIPNSVFSNFMNVTLMRCKVLLGAEERELGMTGELVWGLIAKRTEADSRYLILIEQIKRITPQEVTAAILTYVHEEASPHHRELAMKLVG